MQPVGSWKLELTKISRGRVCVSRLSSTSQFMPSSSTGTVRILAPASSITRYMSGCTGSSITTLSPGLTRSVTIKSSAWFVSERIWISPDEALTPLVPRNDASFWRRKRSPL